MSNIITNIVTNIITLMIARDKQGKAKYERAIFIPKYKKNLQDMPNGAALLMNNKDDKKFLQEIKSLYKRLIDDKILIIHGGNHNDAKHT